MIRWMKSLFAWRGVRNQGVWLYKENAVTGARKAVRINRGGYSPIDLVWLGDGEVIDL
jgi:hypothetical protein